MDSSVRILHVEDDPDLELDPSVAASVVFLIMIIPHLLTA